MGPHVAQGAGRPVQASNWSSGPSDWHSDPPLVGGSISTKVTPLVALEMICRGVCAFYANSQDPNAHMSRKMPNVSSQAPQSGRPLRKAASHEGTKHGKAS